MPNRDQPKAKSRAGVASIDDGWPSDAALLARFRDGDGSSLEPLFLRYEGPVFRFLFGVLKDHHAAEDALQETFVQAMRYADAVAPDSFRGWLFTVAHRQAMRIKRKEKRWPIQADAAALLALVDDSHNETAAELAENGRRVRALLEVLPSVQRDVIVARMFEGKKFCDVAAALGCPLNTALARMHQGLKKLRQLWEARHA